MSTTDTIPDRLLREYESKHTSYKRAVDVVQATLEYELLPIRTRLLPYERLEIVGRVKSFDSAFRKLQGEGRFFDPDRTEEYTFDSLGDMAGVKVRVCPNAYLAIIHTAGKIIRQHGGKTPSFSTR